METETSSLTQQNLANISDVSVRNGFVRKVYGILSAQLLTTLCIGGAVMRLSYMMKTNILLPLLILSLIMSVAMMCICMCRPELMRRSPTNYIILALFTLSESVMVGSICGGYKLESVLVAVAITAIVVIALTIWACTTSVDFTGMGPYLFCFLMVLTGFGLMIAIAGMFAGAAAMQPLRLMYAAMGALLFSVYLVYDTQLIMGGKHQQAFGVDDYCMAAISLYIDIIQLFLYILQLFGERR